MAGLAPAFTEMKFLQAAESLTPGLPQSLSVPAGWVDCTGSDRARRRASRPRRSRASRRPSRSAPTRRRCSPPLVTSLTTGQLAERRVDRAGVEVGLVRQPVAVGGLHASPAGRRSDRSGFAAASARAAGTWRRGPRNRWSGRPPPRRGIAGAAGVGDRRDVAAAVAADDEYRRRTGGEPGHSGAAQMMTGRRAAGDWDAAGGRQRGLMVAPRAPESGGARQVQIRARSAAAARRAGPRGRAGAAPGG